MSRRREVISRMPTYWSIWELSIAAAIVRLVRTDGIGENRGYQALGRATVTGNRGKTPGIGDFRASPDAGEYDSLVACHYLPIRPVYNAPSLRLGSWSCWVSWLN